MCSMKNVAGAKELTNSHTFLSTRKNSFGYRKKREDKFTVST